MGSLRTFVASGLLSLSLCAAASAETIMHPASDHLVDLTSDNWCHDCVVKMVDTFGVMSGFADNTYRGDWTVNRYEFAAAVARSYNQLKLFYKLNLPDTGSSARPMGVSPDHWAYPYVRKLAQENGLLAKFFEDGNFHGERVLTRAQLAYGMVDFLQNMEKKMGHPLDTPRRQSQLADDIDERSPYKPYIEKALNNYQFMNLLRENKFQPEQKVTRYELTAALCKAFALFDIEKQLNASKNPPQSVEANDDDKNNPEGPDLREKMNR